MSRLLYVCTLLTVLHSLYISCLVMYIHRVSVYLVLSYERERHLLFFLHSVPTISVWYMQCIHSLYISLFGDVHTCIV